MPKPTRHRDAKTAKRRPTTTVRERVKRPKGKVWWGFKYITLAGDGHLELYSTLRSAENWADGASVKRYRVEEIG